MNFSLFARRLVSSLPALRIHAASSSVLTSPAFAATRRTFFTTRRIQLPAAAPKGASTTAAKKNTKEPAAKKAAPKKAAAKKAATKKASSKKAKAKPGRKAKPKKVAEKPAAPKKVPKSEQPPPRPPNAYILFFTRLARNQTDKVKSLATTQDVAKQAAAAWKGLTLAEKQPYYDEVEVLKKQYEDKLHDYWKNAPAGILRRINARRRSDGKKMIHRPRQEVANPRPMVPFFRFTQDFRQSHDGKAIQGAGITSAGRPAVNVAREAGSRWRAMSDSEKAHYVEPYQTELAKWTANHSKSVPASA